MAGEKRFKSQKKSAADSNDETKPLAPFESFFKKNKTAQNNKDWATGLQNRSFDGGGGLEAIEKREQSERGAEKSEADEPPIISFRGVGRGV